MVCAFYHPHSLYLAAFLFCCLATFININVKLLLDFLRATSPVTSNKSKLWPLVVRYSTACCFKSLQLKALKFARLIILSSHTKAHKKKKSFLYIFSVESVIIFPPSRFSAWMNPGENVLFEITLLREHLSRVLVYFHTHSKYMLLPASN